MDPALSSHCQEGVGANISVLILCLHVSFSLILSLVYSPSLPSFSPIAKEFKSISGHNKFVGSLDGVTTVEKEKFPKNFWPDVSVCM